MRRKKHNIVVLLIGIIILTGCRPESFPHGETSESSGYNYSTVHINCVDHSLMQNRGKFCTNGEKCYYEEGNIIYSYVDGKREEVFALDDTVDVGFIQAAEDVIYYKVKNSNNHELYAYDMVTKENYFVFSEVNVIDIAIHEKDVFLLLSSNDDARLDTYVVHWKVHQENNAEPILYSNRQNSETIVVDFENYILALKVNYQFRSLSIYSNEDKWTYCYGYEVMVYWNDSLYEENANKIFKDGMEVGELGDDVGETQPEFCSTYNGKLYLYYEYGIGNFNATLTQDYTQKSHDAIYCIDLSTNETQLIYETEDVREQIAGYSAEYNTIYLVREDGLYQRNMDGTGEKRIWQGYCENMLFTICEGHVVCYDQTGEEKNILFIID